MEKPALPSAPKQLTADCIHTFATEKHIPCIPAGIPTCNTSFRYFLSNCMAFTERCIDPFSCIRKQHTKLPLTPLAITVAIPTPATPILKATTKSRFRPTFKIPDKISAYKGHLVSPLHRSTAAPKL